MNITNSSPGPVLEALGTITFYAIKVKPLLPTYFHLLISAVFPIYTAAHASLRRPVSAAPANKKKKRSRKHGRDDDDTNDDESSSPIETLTASDAVLFPILAGFTLSGLYLLIKWLEDPRLLNKILGYYFSWIGIFFCFKFVKDVLYFFRLLIFPSQFSWREKIYKFDDNKKGFYSVDNANDHNGSSVKTSNSNAISRTPARLSSIYSAVRQSFYQEVSCLVALRKPLAPVRLSLSISWLDVVAGLTAMFVAFHTTFGIATPWYLTNLQGFAFCYGSLQFMSPGTSAVGSLLLALLFFYDIYMVFYTPMMVTVATKLDVPIKLLFPKKTDTGRAMAMLGLGDIVVPGIMIAFALRFDLYRHYLYMGKREGKEIALENKQKVDDRPIYTSVRGSWAERIYTAKSLWSSTLRSKDFPKPYFQATVFGYVAGMVATVAIMTIYDHAQPALLYLVPGVLSTFWGMALLKGEIKLAWNFDEAQEEKEKEKREKEAKKDEESKNARKDTKEKKTNDEKQVDGPSKPVLSLHIFLPSSPASQHTKSSSDANDSNRPSQNTQQETPEASKETDQDRRSTNLETVNSESEVDLSDKSSTSSAELISKNEVLDADTTIRDGNEKDEVDEQDTNLEDSVVSTKDDEGGAQAVKRRRRV